MRNNRVANLYLPKLWQKIRYNNILSLIHDGLEKIGINITFFYLVEEGLHLQKKTFDSNEFGDYLIEFLKEDNLDLIHSMPEVVYRKEPLINRMRDGNKCLIVKNKEELIGYTWFNLHECNSSIYKFLLKEDEAYLFDAYVLIKYRGKKIAPFLRYHCYKELKKLNKITLYSISDVLNKQSIGFKKKLNARFLLLGLYVCLFRKWEFNRQIKKFK